MACPACRHPGPVALAPVAGFPLSRCPRCRWVGLRGPLAAEPAYDRTYYERWYVDTEVDRRAAATALLDRVDVPAGAVVVDVGCGPGFALDDARKRGWRALGADPSAAATAIAAEHGAAVVRASAERVPVRARSVAAVLLVDVIAHVHDPATAVREAVAALDRGGMLLVKTPRRPSWLYLLGSRLPAAVARTVLHLPHQRHLFTRRALGALLVGAGLDGVSVEGHPDSVPLPARLGNGPRATVATLVDAAVGAMSGSESLLATGRKVR